MLNDRQYWRPFSSKRQEQQQQQEEQQQRDETQPTLSSQASVYVHALDDTFSTSNPAPLSDGINNAPSSTSLSHLTSSSSSSTSAATTAPPFLDNGAMNKADETAHLKIIDIDKAEDGDNRHRRRYHLLRDKHTYSDVAGEAAFKLSDHRGDVPSVLWTVLRGRAMPLMPMLWSIAWTVFAVGSSYVLRRWSPAEAKGECRAWCTPISVDSDALSYVGFALFLLTSFRVQEAYGRYMEAARTWTTISGTVTSFAQYVSQAFPAGMIHKGDRERILSFLVAFPVALKRELRNERDLSELKNVLSCRDLAELQGSDSMSSYCLYVLSGYMLRARDRESQFPQTFIMQLIRWIADLAGSADKCVQIKTMPAPYSYVTLPFALVEFMGWGTILLVTFISYGLLGIISNSAELEDPFGSDYNDLPLGRMCAKIQEQVNAIFQACRDGSHVFVPTSMDVDDRLFNDASFWLRGCGQQEQQEGKNENEVTICRWSGETMRSRSGDGETCVSVVGETDCLLNKK